MTKHRPLLWDKPLAQIDSLTPGTVPAEIEQHWQEMVAQIHRDQAEMAFEWFCYDYGITIPDDPSAREQLRLSLLASIRAAYEEEEGWR